MYRINSKGAVDPNQYEKKLSKRPAKIESLPLSSKVLQVSCGYDHTAALSTEGFVLT